MKRDALQRTYAVTGFVVGIGLLVPRVAPADEAEDRKAEAQRLFMEGQAALDKGDNPTGCALMRQSLVLFPVANSLFNVAKCDEADGKLRTAHEHWNRGLSLIDPTDPRTPIVQKSIDALEPRIPRVRIVIPPAAQPLTILVNDEEIPVSTLDKPLWVDPGKLVIVIRKAGRKDKQVELVLAARERTEVIAEPGEAVAEVAPVPTGSSSQVKMPPPPPPPPPPPGSGLRIGGFVALGVGGLGLIGAIGTGIKVQSNADELEKQCPKFVCPTEAIRENNKETSESQQTLIPLNTVFWGLGIAGAGAGVVMLVLSARTEKTNPTKAQIVPMVGPMGTGIGLSGRF
jgi:hypothetical protein